MRKKEGFGRENILAKSGIILAKNAEEMQKGKG